MHKGLYHRTPVIESPAINARLGARILFKMECHQPAGSFKVRGVGHLMTVHAKRGATLFVCSSGGNAGLAVAHVARLLGVEAMIVVPETTGVDVRALLASYGSEVRVMGRVWDEADAFARAAAANAGAVYVSPFDDPLLWEGHASMVDELAEEMPPPDAVVLSVGGGGLLCGVLTGMHRNGWRDVPLVAVETEGAASFAAAIAAGAPVRIDAITSVAKSLGALRVADEAVAWTERHDVHSVRLSDAEALRACVGIANDLHVLVEPACGVAMAAIEKKAAMLASCATILMVMCGGSAVGARQLVAWQGALD